MPLRPFHFNVVVWGERFQDYLLDWCLPSLLSPGNIPALKGDGHKFLIAMPFPERERLEKHPNWQRLCRYVEPVFVHIEHGPYDKAACKWMGQGHMKLTQISHQERACGVLLTPDMMISDGAIARLQALLEAGYQVVWTAAQRFNQNRLYNALDGVQIDRDLTPRTLARAALKAFHTETMNCEWDSPHFYQSAPGAWWKMPGGVILHTLSWNSLLIDYSALDAHDTNTLEKWTIDGDYIWRNFGTGARVYTVTDSDEMIQVSWTPEAAEPGEPGYREPPPNKGSRIKRHQAWIDSPKNPENKKRDLGAKNGFTFAQNFWAGTEWVQSKTFDPIKRRVMWLPVYWHSLDIVLHEWQEKDIEIRRTLMNAMRANSEHPDDNRAMSAEGMSHERASHELAC